MNFVLCALFYEYDIRTAIFYMHMSKEPEFDRFIALLSKILANVGKDIATFALSILNYHCDSLERTLYHFYSKNPGTDIIERFQIYKHVQYLL